MMLEKAGWTGVKSEETLVENLPRWKNFLARAEVHRD
jgi:hypothetical protein